MRPRHGSSKYSSTRGRRQRSESGRQPPTRRGTNLNRASERDRCRALQMRDKGYPQGARTHNRHAQSMHVTSEASHQQPSRKMKLQWPLASSLSKRKPGIPHHAAACNVVNTGESNNTSSPSRACERVQGQSVSVGESEGGSKGESEGGCGPRVPTSHGRSIASSVEKALAHSTTVQCGTMRLVCARARAQAEVRTSTSIRASS